VRGGGDDGEMGGLRLPVDIGDQAMCPTGQTDGRSSPMSQADVQWSSSLESKPPINGLMKSVWSFHRLTGLAKIRL